MVRVEAFRQLLASGLPVGADSLASSVVCLSASLVEALDELDAAGRIRRDETGRVIGSAGLSVMPDRHRIELDGRKFWTGVRMTSSESSVHTGRPVLRSRPIGHTGETRQVLPFSLTAGRK